MAERRSLVEGLSATPQIPNKIEKAFVFGSKESAEPNVRAMPAPANLSRTPFSTRLRSDLSAQLKKASLERQLNNETPNSVQDILEEALGNWLKDKGYSN